MNEMEINCQQLKQLIDKKESFTLIDCREPFEYKICRIEGAVLVPLGEFREYFDDMEVESDRNVIVYCHHGIRSMQAAMFLRQIGFQKALSLAGGIEHWSQQIDPEIPRY